MRKIITETSVYKWEELTDDQKQKALENLWDINVDHEWWDYIYDDAKNVKLKLTGFDIDRGSYCEGDFIETALVTASLIIQNHGESCDTYTTAKAYLKQREAIEAKADKDEWGEIANLKDQDILDDLTNEFKRDILNDYLSNLRKEYEYLTSEEAIIDTIEANEYEFTEDGKIAR